MHVFVSKPYVLGLVICFLGGCAASKDLHQEYQQVDFTDGISQEEAIIIAQNKLSHSPGYIYKEVDFYSPTVENINWEDPKNILMRENIIGYYQKFQENWSVRFAPQFHGNVNKQVGCQVWVNKKSGETQVSCSRVNL